MRWWGQLTATNAPADFLAALVIALVVWIALAVAKRFSGRLFTRIAKRTGARWGDLLAGTVRATSLVLLAPVALYAGLSALDAPAGLARLGEAAAVLAVLAQAGLWANRLIALWMDQKLQESRERGAEGHAEAAARLQRFMRGLVVEGVTDLAQVTVALRQIRALVD